MQSPLAVGAAIGGVVFFWNTNTGVKPWMDEINPKTGQVYKSQQEYDETIGGMRDRRKMPTSIEDIMNVDPWAEEEPGPTPDQGDPCDRINLPKCASVDSFKFDSKEAVMKEAEKLFGKGPFRTSPGGSSRGTRDPDFPVTSTHETYLTPENKMFSIGSVQCCESVGRLPSIQTRWAFYK